MNYLSIDRPTLLHIDIELLAQLSSNITTKFYVIEWRNPYTAPVCIKYDYSFSCLLLACTHIHLFMKTSDNYLLLRPPDDVIGFPTLCQKIFFVCSFVMTFFILLAQEVHFVPPKIKDSVPDFLHQILLDDKD